jgi:predicted nucleic-acid-binding protein
VIGIDTNVLARYILDDDPIWSLPAQRFIDEECTVEHPGYVNFIVLAELVWVLQEAPGWGKDEICTVLGDLLLADNLVIENSALVAAALNSFKAGNANFADYLIAAANQIAGAAPTAAIDKAAAKSAGFFRLPANSKR